MSRFLFITLLSALITAMTGCTSSLNKDDSTQIPAQMTEKSEFEGIKRIAIASVNYGQSSPTYLQPLEKPLDALVGSYLEKNDYQLLGGNVFATVWAQNVDQFGEYFDERTAIFRQDRFAAIIKATFDTLKKEHNVDAVLFTDFVVRKVSHSSKGNHYARWDGVKFKPQIKGGDGVPTNYNWGRTFRALSLKATLLDTSAKPLFMGIAGIEMIDMIRAKGGSFSIQRRDNLMSNEKYAQYAIKNALHPFIELPK